MTYPVLSPWQPDTLSLLHKSWMTPIVMYCLRKCPRSLTNSWGHCNGLSFSCSVFFICPLSLKLTLGKYGSLWGTGFPGRDFHVWSTIWGLKTAKTQDRPDLKKEQKGISTRKPSVWAKEMLWNRKWFQTHQRWQRISCHLTVSQAMCYVFLIPISVLRKTPNKGYYYAQLRDEETLTTDTQPVSGRTEMLRFRCQTSDLTAHSCHLPDETRKEKPELELARRKGQSGASALLELETFHPAFPWLHPHQGNLLPLTPFLPAME